MAEGGQFSPEQAALADALFRTKTEAPVKRRKDLGNGEYDFKKVVRPTSPIDFAQTDEDGYTEFALKSHDRNPGAPLSPIYVNLRNLPPELLEQVASVIAQQDFHPRPDFCTGIPNAGDPIAKEFSRLTGIEYIELFGKVETADSRAIVAAENARRGNGARLLLLDDLVTEEETKFEAIRVAEPLDYEVIGIGVLVDRRPPGRRGLEGAGYRLYAAYILNGLVDYYRMTRQINPQRYVEVANYLSTG